MDTYSSTKRYRYYRAHTSSYNTNLLQLKNPWVPVWWSAAFPGMGHIINGAYIRGFIFLTWEFLINLNSQLNLAMVYSFIGRFEMAKEIVNTQWFLLYIAVYIGSIWDSYRETVNTIKLVVLAKKEKAPIVPFRLGSMGLNFLDRRPPWLAAAWSFLMPGMGHMYLKRLPAGSFIIVIWVICMYYSNFLPSFHLTLLGEFQQAQETINGQWFLFMPSLLGFSVYESYVLAIEYYKLYKTVQAEYL
jgi:hypothetical protein